MTNREKYRFDDFTLDNYKRLIKLAKERGFQFILHKDEFVENRKDVIWRHDVEFEPDIALKMAEIEKAENEIKRLEGFLAGIMKKLSNEKFTAHAPAQVVELERKKKADAESKIASLKESVAALKK